MLRADHSRSVAGFSLTEFLVVTGIIGVLLTLALPAIQYARESARRTQCAQNLHALGVALNAFVVDHGRYPPLFFARHDPQTPDSARFSLQSQLLPYLSESAVFDMLNVDALRTSPNLTAGRIVVSGFLCPSNPRPTLPFFEPNNSYRCNSGPFPGWSQANLYEQRFNVSGGAFSYSHLTTRPASITDGLAHTVAMSERTFGSGWPDRFDAFNDLWQFRSTGVDTLFTWNVDQWLEQCGALTNPNPLHFALMGHSWLAPDNTATIYNHTERPNSPIPDCGTEAFYRIESVVSARSYHAGGVHALLLGGNVRFISDRVAIEVWRAAGGRSDGKPSDGL